MLAGALGAIVGDSTLYWIARKSGSHRAVAERLEKANENPKIQTAFAYLDRGAPYLLVAGRFVPGMRFAVSATLGLARYPYKTFLLWSAIGGTAWSIYTCGLAYLIGTALADYPLASIVISGFITTAVLAALFFVERRRRRASAPVPSAPEAASVAP
jgi:membrane protein DedA with SNARE-associated domain